VNFPREIFSAFVQHFVRIFAEFCTVLRENRSPFAKKWDKGDRWIRIGRGGGGEGKKGEKKRKKEKSPLPWRDTCVTHFPSAAGYQRLTELLLWECARRIARIYYVFSGEHGELVLFLSCPPVCYVLYDSYFSVYIGIALGLVHPLDLPARKFPITVTWVEPAWDTSHPRSTVRRRGAHRRTSHRSR